MMAFTLTGCVGCTGKLSGMSADLVDCGDVSSNWSTYWT